MVDPSATYVAFDIGSSSIKAALVRGERWHLSRRWAMPTARTGGDPRLHETDPDQVLNAVRTALVEMCAEADADIAAIGFSTQMHGVILADQDNRPVSPFISWQDDRAIIDRPGGGTYLDQVRRQTEPDLFSKTGLKPRAGLGALNARCWLDQHPTRAHAATRVHTLGSFVLSSLTGEYCTHVTNAAALGVMDLQAGSWHTDLIGALGLDGLDFPRIVHDFRPVGTLAGPGGGIYVHPDVGDHQASVYGTRRDDPDTVCISLGTAGIAARTATVFTTSQRYEVRPYIGGSYLNTVTRLPGGRHFDAVMQLLAAVGRDVFAAAEAENGVRRWVADTVDASFLARLDAGALQVLGGPEGSQLELALPLGTDIAAEELLQGVLTHFSHRYGRAVVDLFGVGTSPQSGALNGGMALANRWLADFFSAQLDAPVALVDGPDLALTGLVQLLHEGTPALRSLGDDEN